MQQKFLQDSIVRQLKVVLIDGFWKEHLFPNYGVSTKVIKHKIRSARTIKLEQY